MQAYKLNENDRKTLAIFPTMRKAYIHGIRKYIKSYLTYDYDKIMQETRIFNIKLAAGFWVDTKRVNTRKDVRGLFLSRKGFRPTEEVIREIGCARIRPMKTKAPVRKIKLPVILAKPDPLLIKDSEDIIPF
jgi:hypothetical protein